MRTDKDNLIITLSVEFASDRADYAEILELKENMSFPDNFTLWYFKRYKHPGSSKSRKKI